MAQQDQLNLALTELNRLGEQLGQLSNDTQGAKLAIDDIKKNLNKKENQSVQNLSNAINVASSVVKNVDNFKSADPIKVATGVLDIVGTIASCCGPKGAVVGALCSLVASILPLFGGGSKEKGLADVVKEVIDKALDDFKNDEIDEKMQVDTMKIQTDLTFLCGIGPNSKKRGIKCNY